MTTTNSTYLHTGEDAIILNTATDAEPGDMTARWKRMRWIPACGFMPVSPCVVVWLGGDDDYKRA